MGGVESGMGGGSRELCGGQFPVGCLGHFPSGEGLAQLALASF